MVLFVVIIMSPFDKEPRLAQDTESKERIIELTLTIHDLYNN